MRERSTRVLIVDDNPDISSYLDLWLRMYGFSTRVANGGAEGLQAAEEQKPDAILLDLSMPHMDGLEVAKRLADREWRDDVLLIAHTAHGDRHMRSVTDRLGFDLHLQKPADPRTMADAISAWRETRDAAKAARSGRSAGQREDRWS